MSTVQDIKDAILTLDGQARRDLLTWFQEQDERDWDEQIGRDFDAGKLQAARLGERRELET